ncbi:unnamed protein product [Diamesa tonsa]
MCYVVLTTRSLLWFLLSLLATMLVLTALVTPEWLVSANPIKINNGNYTSFRYPSLGLNSRCKLLTTGFSCGSFSLSTDSTIFPVLWKIAFVFISIGFFTICLTLTFTLVSCCRQSIFGKSIHTVTGCLQMLAGILVLIATSFYPIGWGNDRVVALCGDSSPFYPSDCSIGYSFYSAVAGIFCCFICGFVSLKAEKANMSTTVKRRLEEGGEKLVCVP